MISFRVISTFLIKEFRQIIRSREMIAVIFIMPILQLLVMGFAVSNEVKHVRLAVIDHDNTALSRDLIASFTTTDRFDLVAIPANSSPVSLIQNWKAQVVIVIPPGFAKDLALRRVPALQIVLDGIDGNTASIAGSYSLGVLQTYMLKRLSDYDPSLLRSLLSRRTTPEIIILSRMWYNPELRSASFIIPGLIAVLVTIGSMLLSAMSLVREKELGTLEQLLVTPVRKAELLLGKLLPFWLITMIQLTISVAFAGLIFGIRVSGSLASLYLFSGLYLFTSLGLGIITSSLTSSQQQAMFFAWFCMVFMILLGGLFVPAQNMTPLVKAMAAINPLNHYIVVIREIVIKGSRIRYLYREFLTLTAFGIVFFGTSMLVFRKRM